MQLTSTTLRAQERRKVITSRSIFPEITHVSRITYMKFTLEPRVT